MSKFSKIIGLTVFTSLVLYILLVENAAVSNNTLAGKLGGYWYLRETRMAITIELLAIVALLLGIKESRKSNIYIRASMLVITSIICILAIYGIFISR